MVKHAVPGLVDAFIVVASLVMVTSALVVQWTHPILAGVLFVTAGVGSVLTHKVTVKRKDGKIVWW